MEAKIKITSTKITPNPVDAGGSVIVSVGIEPRIFGLATAAGKIVRRADGKVIITRKE